MSEQDDAGPDWEQHDQLMRERYALAVEALNRCAAAGAKPDDITGLALECGIDPKHITIGADDAAH